MKNNLTTGNLGKAMLHFSLPYLIACFLQTFYGMADLFITGRYNGAEQVTAVSIGSQVMHMLTVVVVGLAMGTTVCVSHAVGAKDWKRTSRSIGNSILIFAVLAVVSTGLLLLGVPFILNLLQTPSEALHAARQYLLICFAGVPFIIAYNVISSIFRGLGDTKRPMVFVAIAGVFNVGLDYVLIGICGLGAAGAALATVSAQAISVLLALVSMKKMETHVQLKREDFRFQAEITKNLLGIGTPIACQDGLIQISFLTITMIANMRGLAVATAVGIVEKIISFLFLVPSAMLSTVSTIAAQNVGAGFHERGRKTLRYGICFCIGFGIVISLICQVAAGDMVGLFVSGEPEIVAYGIQYLHAYCLDCIFAGIHFCFSGYFSAYGKSMYSFAHNMISTVTVRVPGSYLASILFPATLYPMGLAAPAGSLLSAIICVGLYAHFVSKKKYSRA